MVHLIRLGKSLDSSIERGGGGNSKVQTWNETPFGPFLSLLSYERHFCVEVQVPYLDLELRKNSKYNSQ